MGALVLAVILALNTANPAENSVVRRVLEIVLGTAVSLALLPDEPFRIWNLKSSVLAETVPTEKLHYVAQEVVEALALQADGAVGPDDVAMLWKSFSSDVRQVLGDPARVVRDMQYRVVVSRTTGAVGSRRLTTEIDSIRYSDEEVPVQITVCSDVVSLEREFERQDSGCVLREVVPLLRGESIDDWTRRVVKGVHHVIIDGTSCEVADTSNVVYPGAMSLALRIRFLGNLKKGAQVRAVVRTEFLTEQLFEFPIRFSSYYCIGSTRIIFEIHEKVDDLEVHNFLAMGFGQHELVHKDLAEGHSVSVATSDHAVLAPGSGLLVSWSPLRGGSR